MALEITEIATKSALVRSRIPGVKQVINPYLGCAHGCRYCYAVFMRKYSRHHAASPWGSFVEPKVNIPQVLRAELRRRKGRESAFLSSVCDPYQPVELKYRLTRQCLEILQEAGWGIDILTRSPLVVRDLDLLSAAARHSVGLTIPTDDDGVRRVLEPHSPPIGARLQTLRRLREAGLRTWVFIAPVLPMNPRRLCAAVEPFADRVLIDALNYRGQVRRLFKEHHWEYALTDQYAQDTSRELLRLLGDKGEGV